RELHQIRICIVLDRRFEVFPLYPQVVEAVGEDLDVSRLVQGLSGEEKLARFLRGRIGQARRGRPGTAVAEHELNRSADGFGVQHRVVEQELGLSFPRRVPVFGVLEVALRARFEPALDRVSGQHVSHGLSSVSDEQASKDATKRGCNASYGGASSEFHELGRSWLPSWSALRTPTMGSDLIGGVDPIYFSCFPYLCPLLGRPPS